MMDDTTRKVRLVIYHNYRNEWAAIDLKLICRFSMRSEQQVKDAINWLVKEGYLQWDKNAKLIRIPFK